MKRKVMLIAIIVFGAVGGISGYFWQKSKPQEIEPTTQNSVKPNETANWKTSTTSYEGVTFKYPELTTTYIRPQQWPPQLTLTSDVFSCKEGGLGINGLPGMAIQKTIREITYCIESVSEGTAGTTYTTYTYTFQKDTKLIKFVFILAYPQCDNYNEPNKTTCVNERQTFDLDTLIDKMAQTVQL